MCSGSNDSAVPFGIALLACVCIELAFKYPFAAAAAKRLRQCGKHTAETVFGGCDRLAHFADLIRILEHALDRCCLVKRIVIAEYC